MSRGGDEFPLGLRCGLRALRLLVRVGIVGYSTMIRVSSSCSEKRVLVLFSSVTGNVTENNSF